MRSRAFCPAHVTGFFTVSDEHKDPENTGSRGAGFSIDLGAHVEAEVEGHGWIMEVNGVESSFLLVEKVVRSFAPGGHLTIETDVPFSQGLGMSGACALAAGLAVCDAIGTPQEEAVIQSHRSELFCRTGLGDVVAQSVGGFEVRLKEGIPPYGVIEKHHLDRELVIAVVGLPLVTTHVLSDPVLTQWIKLIGDECMDDFVEDISFERFLDISRQFSTETEFIKGPVERALAVGDEYGKGSMCMIGNSVFFHGDTHGLKAALSELAGENNVYVVKIDKQGARIV